LRQEQKESSHLGGELPTVGQSQLMDVGHGWHERTVLGEVSRSRRGPAALPLGSQTFVLQDAEEIGFADGMAFGVQSRANLRQGVAQAAQVAGAVADGLAFGRRSVHGLGSVEELSEILVASEVADQRADGVYL